MKVVLQRVSKASVSVNGKITGQIGKGILILLAIRKNDTQKEADFLASKCAELRIFEDEQGKMNHSLLEINGMALVISQFTLYGDCRKGRRPSYSDAAPPDKGNALYEYFIQALKKYIPDVQTGIFGAMMDVELINDGPVTLILEKNYASPEGDTCCRTK